MKNYIKTSKISKTELLELNNKNVKLENFSEIKIRLEKDKTIINFIMKKNDLMFSTLLRKLNKEDKSIQRFKNIKWKYDKEIHDTIFKIFGLEPIYNEFIFEYLKTFKEPDEIFLDIIATNEFIDIELSC
jgi:hypothetical protein